VSEHQDDSDPENGDRSGEKGDTEQTTKLWWHARRSDPWWLLGAIGLLSVGLVRLLWGVLEDDEFAPATQVVFTLAFGSASFVLGIRELQFGIVRRHKACVESAIRQLRLLQTEDGRMTQCAIDEVIEAVTAAGIERSVVRPAIRRMLNDGVTVRERINAIVDDMRHTVLNQSVELPNEPMIEDGAEIMRRLFDDDTSGQE
jgi:hypothetical protein